MTQDERLSSDFNKGRRQYFPVDSICKRSGTQLEYVKRFNKKQEYMFQSCEISIKIHLHFIEVENSNFETNVSVSLSHAITTKNI